MVLQDDRRRLSLRISFVLIRFRDTRRVPLTCPLEFRATLESSPYVTVSCCKRTPAWNPTTKP